MNLNFSMWPAAPQANHSVYHSNKLVYGNHTPLLPRSLRSWFTQMTSGTWSPSSLTTSWQIVKSCEPQGAAALCCAPALGALGERKWTSRPPVNSSLWLFLSNMRSQQETEQGIPSERPREKRGTLTGDRKSDCNREQGRWCGGCGAVRGSIPIWQAE